MKPRPDKRAHDKINVVRDRDETMQVNMRDAKSQLSKLVKAAEKGAIVVIVRHGIPVARLVPYHTGSGLRSFGALKGRKHIDEAFAPAIEAQIAKMLEKT